MKNILILGAGRTASSLVDYLASTGLDLGWQLCVADRSLDAALGKIRGYPNASAIEFDTGNSNQGEKVIQSADLVISLLPVTFHLEVAKTCLKFKKHLLTASYVSEAMMGLNKEATNRGVLLLNECGLDPGIDHMTAMTALDSIRLEQGGVVDSFLSYTGGLIAPESDNNPWHYKFTWNPRNVVLAGKETAQFIRNGHYKYIPYHRLFTRIDKVKVAGFGEFEAYANRDSLRYRELYGLQTVETMLRGTLRRPGFCHTWNILVQLGLTDDSYLLEEVPNMTFRDFVNMFLPYHPTKSVEDKLCDYLNLDPQGDTMQMLAWLGLFDRVKIGLDQGSPADILQNLLERKWKLEPGDRDMIIMQHQIGYAIDGSPKKLVSSLAVTGDSIHTAISKTVGWPLGIAAKLILTGAISDCGVKLPLTPEYYRPIIKELEQLGVEFIAEVEDYSSVS